ncbi:MAG: PD-(D/E)XK nuclease family protein, partial [Amoebophilaceae bacterium]|nr:PD-(D/E)XK nuclease family protein [Amoebophilaceae bacterium]
MALPTSFIEDLAAELYAQHRHRFHEITVVFPTWRAVEVFKRCLAAHLSQPTWAPKVLSIETLMQQLSPLKRANTLLLTHTLYQTFQALKPREESFEQFYFWGSVLLQDLDVIEKYLVDADHLFTDLSQQKELSLSYDYLTEAQRATIQSFWKNFEQRLSTHQQEFLGLWKLLPAVYQHFKKRLQDQGAGYQGLCHRAAYEALVAGTTTVPRGQWVFAGFNVLTPVKEKILAWYQRNLPTSFCWDLDAYYMEDMQQEAGVYLRAHQKKSYFQASFGKTFPKRLSDGVQEIHLTAVASEVGQAQVMGAQLQALMEAQGADFVPQRTAIVLANESLLLPVLHALALNMTQVSTHLGYPLKNTTTYHLLEHLLVLQSAAQEQSTSGYWATQHVLSVLNHPCIMSWDVALAQATINRIKEAKHSYVDQATLVQENSPYATIFNVLGSQDCLLQYLIEVVEYVKSRVEASDVSLHSLEKVALHQLLRQLGRLQEVLTPPLTKGEALLQLLRQLVQSVRLPLGLQSPDGIQVLDIRATRNLDFDHVFIVGMNEGHFPAQTSSVSFIPYSLRKGYGLPTADQHQAALYAYYFYRLLQRARQVYITYSTKTAAGNQSEMSRYLWQLLYESKLPLKKKAIAQPIYLPTIQPIVIPKKESVWQQLRRFILQPDGTGQHLTPSALNTYLDCSLRFYFHYLVRLQSPAPPQQATHALVFGRFLHAVMERLYTPLMKKKRGQPLQLQDLEVLQKGVKLVVKNTFASTFHPGQHQWIALQGGDAIAQAVMTKLVKRILVLDQAYAPFVLIGLEVGRQVPLYLDFDLDPATRVRLRGIIDRVDWKAGVFRVLDYKTGLDEKKIKSIPLLFDRTVFRRNKAAFQTFFYAWLFQQRGQAHVATMTPSSGHQTSAVGDVSIMPGLLNTRQLFEDHFDSRFFF